MSLRADDQVKLFCKVNQKVVLQILARVRDFCVRNAIHHHHIHSKFLINFLASWLYISLLLAKYSSPKLRLESIM
jgi:hypothetical protein